MWAYARCLEITYKRTRKAKLPLGSEDGTSPYRQRRLLGWVDWARSWGWSLVFLGYWCPPKYSPCSWFFTLKLSWGDLKEKCWSEFAVCSFSALHKGLPMRLHLRCLRVRRWRTSHLLPRLKTRVQSLGPMWCMVRTDSRKWSSDLYRCSAWTPTPIYLPTPHNK